MARARRPSEVRSSWKHDGIRIDIDDRKLYIVAKKGMRPQLARILDRIVLQAKAITSRRTNHPYSKTGNLTRSIERTPIRDVNQHSVKGSVTAGGPIAPYARFVHEGTRPHIIRARPENPTGMLRFYWVRRGDFTKALHHDAAGRFTTADRAMKTVHFTGGYSENGSLFIGPSVRHPGSRPKPFLLKAARDVTGYTAVRKR